MAKDVKERKNKNGSKTIKMGDDEYFNMSEGGQKRAKALGYSGLVYTPKSQADIDRAHKMAEMGGAHGLVGASMLLNYVALRVASEEDEKNLLKKNGTLK